MNEEMKRVVEQILTQVPVCAKNEKALQHSQYVVTTGNDGGSLICAFNRWSGKSIVQTEEVGTSEYQVRALVLTADEMDAICAAWLSWRAEYDVPSGDVEPSPLGDLEDHPF